MPAAGSTHIAFSMARWAVAAAIVAAPLPLRAETLEIGIGTQNTTTNTVTGGIVLKELGLLEKHLPKTGKYQDMKYTLSWQNFTSGPPVTNGMMADNIQIGMMGDYPLLVNGATGQATGNETQLVTIIAYNAFGGGNGIVVHKDSPYFDLADLKGKNVSVPFGSAAHGMMLQALQTRGWLPTSGIWYRNPRKSARPTCRKSASTRTATSCHSPNCCRSAALRAKSSTAPKPRYRRFTAWSCARISARNIPRS
jgi:ABC-type nitrate/sulfonate/bicarbonate transport system substrate-binding protein